MSDAETTEPEDQNLLGSSDADHHSKADTLFEKLFEINGYFTQVLDLGKLLPLVLHQVIETVRVEAGSIWIYDSNSNNLICKVAEGSAKDKIVGLRLPLGQGIVGEVVKTSKSKVVFDTSKEESFRQDTDKKTGFHTKSMICVPFLVQGRAIGAIQVINKSTKESGLFDQLDFEFVKQIATIAAMQIKTVQLFDAERRARDFGSILKISREITSTLDVDKVLFSLVNMSQKLLNYDRAVILLIRDKQPRVSAMTESEESSQEAENFLYERLATQAIELGKEIVIQFDREIPDVLKEESLKLLKERQAQSLLLIPMNDQEGCAGVLVLESKNKEAFGRSQQEAAHILVSQATVAVRNAELYQMMPMTNIVSKYREKRQKIKSLPKKKKQLLFAGVVALLVFFFFPFWDIAAAGDCELSPLSTRSTKVYVLESGLVENFSKNVQEGGFVKEGQVIASFRKDDLLTQLSKKRTELESARLQVTQSALNPERSVIGLAKLKLSALEIEEKFLQEKIQRLDIRAPCSGYLKLNDLNTLVGKSFQQGEEFCEVIPMEELRLTVKVPEAHITDVQPNMDIVFKIKSDPSSTFEANVGNIFKSGEETESGKVFSVIAHVDNPFIENNGQKNFLLRSGFTGRAKVILGKTNLVSYLFREPLRKFRFWLF